MLIDNNGQNPMGTAYSVNWPYKYDMAGPGAPVDVHVGIGEDALVMGWTQAGDAPTDLKQYTFLCDPPPGSEVTGAGGEGADVPPLEQVCGSNAFTEGQVPSYSVITDLPMRRRSVDVDLRAGWAARERRDVHGSRSSRATATTNVGPVSNVACGTPEPVTDFYEAYRAAGGRGGGGFCSIARVPTHAMTLLFAFGAIGLVLRRRARARNGRGIFVSRHFLPSSARALAVFRGEAGPRAGRR